jgi:hypothetical protein
MGPLLSPFSSDKVSDFDTQFRQTRNIHIFYLIGNILYGVLGVIIKFLFMGSEPGFVGLPSSTYSMLLVIFSIVSVGLAVFVLFIFPKLNSPQNLIKREPVSSSEELGKILSKMHMTRVALAEAIAIFGVFLFFLNGELLPLFAFSGFTFILMLLIIPRRTEWDEAQALIENDMA